MADQQDGAIGAAGRPESGFRLLRTPWSVALARVDVRNDTIRSITTRSACMPADRASSSAMFTGNDKPAASSSSGTIYPLRSAPAATTRRPMVSAELSSVPSRNVVCGRPRGDAVRQFPAPAQPGREVDGDERLSDLGIAIEQGQHPRAQIGLPEAERTGESVSCATDFERMATMTTPPDVGYYSGIPQLRASSKVGCVRWATRSLSTVKCWTMRLAIAS